MSGVAGADADKQGLGHPERIEVDWKLAVDLVRLLDGLSGVPLLSYHDDGPFEYEGRPIAEAGSLGQRLRDSVAPGFQVGDKVVSTSRPKKVGTVQHMTLFESGWYVGVEFDDELVFTDGIDLEIVQGE